MSKTKPNKTITLFQYVLSTENDIVETHSPEDTFDPFLNPEITDEENIQISVNKLGEGGMGIVYEGLQRYPQRPIAIKRLKKRCIRSEILLKQEAMITGKLNHPNILPIYIFRPTGVYGPEVIMPLLKGKNLQEYLEENTLSLRKKLYILNQVSHALAYAHAQNIFHRDIKPENIMIGEFGDVYLVDWGIALDKSLDTQKKNRLVGTPAYMAPEMLDGDPTLIDARTDIYLLGATLHHLLTDEPRHIGDNFDELKVVIKKSAKFEFDKEIFTELGDFCNRCCHPNPDKRPQDIKQFQAELSEKEEHWNAMEFIQKGNLALTELSSIHDPKLAYSKYLQTRILFEQALSSWPKSKTAQKGIIKTIELMISKLIKVKELGSATTLFAELKSLSPTHRALPKIQEQLQTLQKEQHLIKQKALENDMSFSRETRVLVAKFLTFLAVIMVLFVIYEIVFLQKENNYTLLFSTMLIPVVSFLGTIIVFSKKLLHNQASRRAVTIVGTTMTLMLFNRGLGILYEEELNRILTLDIFAMSIFWAHMAVQIPFAIILLIVHLCFSFLCIWDPSFCFWLMNIGAVLTGCSTAWLWARGDF